MASEDSSGGLPLLSDQLDFFILLEYGLRKTFEKETTGTG
jgi:hypothetical protein